MGEEPEFDRDAACEQDDIDGDAREAAAEWPDIDVDVEAIVNRIAKLHRYIERAAVDTRGSLGLTQGEVRVLFRLAHQARSPGDMAKSLIVSTGTMTNRIDKLERAGLVARRPDPTDRRGVIIELTPRGRDTLARYVSVQAQRERQMLSRMSPEERAEVSRLLRETLSSVEAEAGVLPKPH